MLSLLISILNSARNVLQYIAHIDSDKVIFQICLPSHSPLLLQYWAQNLGGKEMYSHLGEGVHGGTSKHVEGVGEINI